MRSFVPILIYLLSMHVVLASQCNINDGSSTLEVDTAISLSKNINTLTNISICESFSKDSSYLELKAKLGIIVANQTNNVLQIKDRHEMGNALNACEPNKDSKAFVVSFAGTGAYNPRTHSLLARVIKCESFQNLPESFKKSAYDILFKELETKNSAFTKWSGIDKGIMSEFISDKELNTHAKSFDFAIFPSEESEIIADPENININTISDIDDELEASTFGFPKGISNAKDCLLKYAQKSKELNIHPKFIILSHSSGGRSAVKFLEQLKRNKIEADLVLSIDPVIEAQHAIAEVADQYVGQAYDYLNPFSKKNKPVRVWSRKYPKKLYKTNAKKWVNFYQKDDSHGIGMTPSFGIYGSPIIGGENHKIDNTGDSGHGKITYTEEVLRKMKENILNLFE